MLTIKRIAAVLMLLAVLGLSAPQALADPGEIQSPPGETQTPPGETNGPPRGETSAPPGETNTPPGEVNTPPAAGMSAWMLFQFLANGWRW